MSSVQTIKEIKSSLDNLEVHVQKTQHRSFNIISGLVKLHQEYRIAKNYKISDELRNLLNENDIHIVQGTKQYGGYENIPDNMKNNTVDDTWFYKNKHVSEI